MESENISALDSIFAEIAKEAGEDPEMIKRSFFEKIAHGELKADEK